MARRVQSCLDASGGHFQHMLWCRHISYTTRKVRFKFRCNILISGKIIKEMPGSVASGTHGIMCIWLEFWRNDWCTRMDGAENFKCQRVWPKALDWIRKLHSSLCPRCPEILLWGCFSFWRTEKRQLERYKLNKVGDHQHHVAIRQKRFTVTTELAKETPCKKGPTCLSLQIWISLSIRASTTFPGSLHYFTAHFFFDQEQSLWITTYIKK